ncbi:ankyrin repeat domain-containing protein [Kistimonas asteriae]|uniref:ankyrin repeat domain-containing protein n=1 Tax=Kistimonas asteriae TaxID=517724 RepID=UPI001BA6D92A|nr:ankyrin repeat domain-containing protein [Kistimonas asteriae]
MDSFPIIKPHTASRILMKGKPEAEKTHPNLGCIETDKFVKGYVLSRNNPTPKECLFQRTAHVTFQEDSIETDSKETSSTLLFHQTTHALSKLNPANRQQSLLTPEVSPNHRLGNIIEQAHKVFHLFEELTTTILDQGLHTIHTSNTSSSFMMWHTDKEGPEEAPRYSSPIVTCFLAALSNLLEEHVYKKIPRHDDREQFFNLLQNEIHKSNLTQQQKDILNELISNADQTDRVLFNLSCFPQATAVVEHHHDEFCPLLVDDQHTIFSRHANDNSPYHLIKMANAFEYALKADLSSGLQVHHLRDIMVKLGFSADFTKPSTETFVLREGHFSTQSLSTLLNRAVFVTNTRAHTEKCINFIRNNITTEVAILASSDNASYLEAQPEINCQASFKFSDKTTELTLKRMIPVNNILERLQTILEEFNKAAMRNKRNPEQLRRLVIKTTGSILSLQPFPSGNRELAIILYTLLCRQTGIRHARLPISHYLLLPESELEKLESAMLLNPTTAQPYINTQNPLTPFIKSGNPRMLRALLDNGLSHLVNTMHDNTIPLMYASQRDNVDMIRLLIEHGADVNRPIHETVRRNTEDKTVLQEACRQRTSFEQIELLIRSGAEIGNAFVELRQYQNRLTNPQHRRSLEHYIQNMSNEIRPSSIS